MWRWYTAEDRRQAAATGALLLVLGITAVGVAPVIAGLILSGAHRYGPPVPSD